jgi:hypothetical protein
MKQKFAVEKLNPAVELAVLTQLVELPGLATLEKLNVGWCIGVRNSDIKHLAGTNSTKHLP